MLKSHRKTMNLFLKIVFAEWNFFYFPENINSYKFFKNSHSANISVVFFSLQSTSIFKIWILLQFLMF